MWRVRDRSSASCIRLAWRVLDAIKTTDLAGDSAPPQAVGGRDKTKS